MSDLASIATAADELMPSKSKLFDGSSSPEEFVALGDGFCREILVKRARLRETESILDLGAETARSVEH